MTKQNVELITNLILDYFGAVKYVHQKSKPPKEEKLKRLLDPLIKLSRILFPLPFFKENPYRRYDDTYPFISERVYKDDLDLNHLEYDKSKYSINWCENDRIPDRQGPKIWPYETKEERRLRKKIREEEQARRGIELEDEITIHKHPQDLYRAWLPTLDEEKIQSRDLLDQILVCYTIKRAINGDKKAIEKLYSLYEYAAEGIGVQFWRYNKEICELDEVKNTARILLRLIIEGFSPERIISNLLQNEKETIPHLPGWAKDFFIYYLSEYVPPRILEVLEELKLVKGSGQRGRLISLLRFKLVALLNPYTPIRDGGKSLVISRKFNTYCFRPGVVKMGPYHNLSTWIFGRRKEINTLTKGKREDGTIGKAWQPYGKLYQLIRDGYRFEIKRYKVEKNFDFLDRPEEDQGGLSLKEKNKALSDKKKRFDKPPEQIITELEKHGILHRNAEIFTEWKFSEQPITQEEIAQKFNLSRRQIIRICNKITHIFNTSS